MSQFAGQQWLCAFTVLTALARAGGAQDVSSPLVLANRNPSQKGVLACIAGTNFEEEHYRIVHISVDDPFKFLYVIARKANDLEAKLKAKLENQPFTYGLVDADALGLIEAERFVPITGKGFTITVELVSVQNCDPNAKTLDLIYRIYSTNPPKFLGGATESQTTAKQAPQTTTGLAKTGTPIHFTPAGGYNRAYGFFGGGRVQIERPIKGFHLFDTFTAEGLGSYSIRTFSAALSGSVDRRSWLKHADWRLNYQNSRLPSGAGSLSKAGLSGQIDAETRPFWKRAVMARFGGLVQEGIAQSAAPAGLLPPQTVSNTGYGVLRGYAGLSSRTRYNVFSASYGLELGSIGHGVGVDWRKHIGDVADEFWIPIGDHKPLEVESRITFGGIQVPHSIPFSARFFGGNAEEYFIPGDSWQIRAAPVIRAIPANRLYLTSQGAGADRFTSINLTFAYPVKTHPMMPTDLSKDKQFNDLLQGQITTAKGTEQNYYSWKDPKFGEAYRQLDALKQSLDRLQKAVETAQAAHPGQLPDEFGDCTDNIVEAQFYLDSARKETKSGQYGNVYDLVSPSAANHPTVQAACAVEVNRTLNDPGITAAIADYDRVLNPILDAFNAINQKTAAAKAAADIAFVDRTLNTLFKDLNIFSISPVAVFDAAWIGPGSGAMGGVRKGPGFGIRLELVSYVNFTFGCAWNVDRRPGEGTKALFFSIGIRDLFH